MASKKWVDYRKTLGKQLTDNVRANEAVSPLYYIFALFMLHLHHQVPIWSGKLFTSGVFYALISTLVYVFASNYFQPDLDIHRNRPGMGHFPFGRWVGAYKYGRFLKWVAFPVNRLWYYLWHPYGQLLTHRGVGHWPLIGVWLRVGYLLLLGLWLQQVLIFFNLSYTWLDPILNYFNWFFPWSKAFGSVYWFLYCFPIFISDLIHIAVDYRDSARRGISFCPPAIPRGLIMQIINGLKQLKK
jgi:uncharacterized metal-binding protein